MATPLRVPRQYEGGFAKIRDLSDESTRELLAALREAPDTFNQNSLSLAVAKQVDTIAASDVEEIVPALLSLYAHRDHSQSAISDAAEGIAQAMEESRSERFRLSPEERDDFEKRLALLLNVDQLNIVARAGRLLLENEHSLREARIVTDARPVFEPDNPEAHPKAAVMVHMLKLSYRGDNTTKNFIVALDNNDLRDLREQIERAISKIETLESVLKAAGVPHIDAR